ncbi:hypothetical protein FRC07_002427, partial [Ceratobasidium sp. 392]
VEKVWAEARAKAEETPGEEDLLVDLWTWGIRHLKHPDMPKRMNLWKAILRESLSHTSTTLHAMLLLRRLYDQPQSPSDRAVLAKQLIAQYRPSITFFDRAMNEELENLLAPSATQAPDKQEEPPRKKRKKGPNTHAPLTGIADTSCLEALYTAWRIIPDQHIPAALKWATSLWRLGEEQRADDSIIAIGGSKGKLKHEWERLREELSSDRVGYDADKADLKDSDVAETDIALENVEFT